MVASQSQLERNGFCAGKPLTVMVHAEQGASGLMPSLHKIAVISQTVGRGGQISVF